MILTFSILSDRWKSLVNINIINMGYQYFTQTATFKPVSNVSLIMRELQKLNKEVN